MADISKTEWDRAILSKFLSVLCIKCDNQFIKDYCTALKRFIEWTLHMIMYFFLHNPVTFHILKVLLTVHPISSYILYISGSVTEYREIVIFDNIFICSSKFIKLSVLAWFYIPPICTSRDKVNINSTVLHYLIFYICDLRIVQKISPQSPHSLLF